MMRSDASPTAPIPNGESWPGVVGGTSAVTTGPGTGPGADANPTSGPTRDPASETAASPDDGGSGDGFDVALAAVLRPALVLERELAGGAIARVFVAREVALDRRVVVKVLPPPLAAGISRDRFRLEIQLAAQLQHPHIVPLLAAGEVGSGSGDAATAAAVGSLYYTMPFIEGESLRAELAARGARGTRFTWREVLRIFRDVAEALGYAHARGVVHRDVKPGNVLLLHGHALVTDFGVAKALASAAPVSRLTTMTTLGVAIGTPAYMAPEQLAADPAADHRMDLYAAGLVAYELLSGESPFAAASPQATLAAQLTRVPTDIAAVRPDIPRALAAAVMQCLAKDPAERPATAEALLATLDAVGDVPSAGAQAAEMPVGAASTAPVAARAPRVGTRARMRQAGVSVAILAVAIIGAVRGGAWFARGVTGAVPHARVAAMAPIAAAAAPVGGAPVGGTAVAVDGGRPTLSRADSAAIAAAVEREFQRAAVRHAAPHAPNAGVASVGGAPTTTTTTGDTAALRRAARAAVVDSLVSVGDRWSRYSPDMVRAIVGRLPFDVRRVPHMPYDRPTSSGDAPSDGGPRPPIDGAEPFARGERPGAFANMAAALPPRAAGTRRVVLVMLRDGTGQHALAPVAPLVEAALRTQLRTLGAYELTDQGFGAVIRHEHVPDRDVAHATDATAVLRGTITAAADRVRAVVMVYDGRRGVPAVVQADAPVGTGATAPALADALASPLARAIATMLDAM